MISEDTDLSKEKIKNLIAETVISLADNQDIDCTQLDPSMSLESLSEIGFDSLAIFQLLCEIEHELGISIGPEDADAIVTLDDLVNLAHDLATSYTES